MWFSPVYTHPFFSLPFFCKRIHWWLENGQEEVNTRIAFFLFFLKYLLFICPFYTDFFSFFLQTNSLIIEKRTIRGKHRDRYFRFLPDIYLLSEFFLFWTLFALCLSICFFSRIEIDAAYYLKTRDDLQLSYLTLNEPLAVWNSFLSFKFFFQ